jgi:peptidyl-prolyl cis-trans isomerase SurA
MKNRLLTLLIAVPAIFCTTTVTGQSYQPGVIDKTIALIGGDMIQMSALENEVQMMIMQGITSDKYIRCEILEHMLEQKLFLNQARLDSLKVNYEYVEANLNNRIQDVMSKLGGEKAMEEYFNKPLFKIKEEWRETLSDQSLVEQMQGNIVDKAPELTPSDVERFYKNTSKDSLPIVPTQYQIRQIVYYPDKEASVMAIKEKLLEIRERIMKGEKFSSLATIYSQDPGSAIRGGELGMMARQMLWPAYSDAAYTLKPGQISQIVQTPDGFHIIQLISRDGNMFNSRHILLKPSYTSEDRNKAFKKLDSLKTLILADSIKFEIAARRNSQDLKSALNGGLVSDDKTGSVLFDKDHLKAYDYNILKDMKIGDISEPFESVDNEGREGQGNTIYKIIKLEKIIPSHIANFKEDFSILLNLAKNMAAQEEIDKFIKKSQATTFIRIDPSFQNCPFKREGWIKK